MHSKLLLTLFVVAFSIGSCSDNNSNDTIDPTAPSFPCVNGLADDTYACNNVDLFAVLTPSQLLVDQPVGNLFVNDIWGWTDSQTNKEYALVGVNDGVTFVDISNPNDPIVLGKLPQPATASKEAFINPTGNTPIAPGCWFKSGDDISAQSFAADALGSTWRDLKVFNDHLFVVADGQRNHGMQVFDLTQLRNVENAPATFSPLTVYNQLESAHNIAINEATGFAYATGVRIGSECSNGGLHIIDINDPANPTFAGCYNDPESRNTGVGFGYIHDTQCMIYNGPDSDYTGSEVCISGSEEGFTITNLDDKSNPATITLLETGNTYAHQGWLTEDSRFYLLNDELDETNSQLPTTTYIWNVEDLDNPVFVGTHRFSTSSIDHNLYVRGNFVYESNYTSGLRILDISNIASGNLTEAAFFDTFPLHDAAAFLGTWSNYPYFNSGNVIASDVDGGLFILKPNTQ